MTTTITTSNLAETLQALQRQYPLIVAELSALNFDHAEALVRGAMPVEPRVEASVEDIAKHIASELEIEWSEVDDSPVELRPIESDWWDHLSAIMLQPQRN